MSVSASDFVHLHVHSEYSLLDGANRVGALAKEAKRQGSPAIALTDHGVMFGAHAFRVACEKTGVKPIFGCELYITPGSMRDRPPREQKSTHHLLLLAADFEGYTNLGRLSTIGHTEGFYYKPRIDFEVLAAHAKGLIATSSCMSGLIPRALIDGRTQAAEEYLRRFLSIFGRERFFVELQEHGIPEQRALNTALLKMAREAELKVIATNDAHYLRREDAKMHDLLLCIQTNATLADPGRMKFDSEEFYVKPVEEMEALFPGMPEALTNTRLVAEMCNVVFPKKEYHLPKFPCPEGVTEVQQLRADVAKGIAARYGERAETDETLRSRVEFELGVIERMGFASYFLIVADFIAYARSIDIPVGPGRGSAAGSVVAYALGITQLCPLEHGLLFERFLNPDRLSMPDIDVDFCFARRGEVIEYVRRKYGEQCVSQIITFGTLKAKLAVKDVGRALGVPLPTVNQIAKLIPDGPKVTLKEAIEESAELKAMAAADAQVKQVLEFAQQVEGMVRHAGTHAAGVVISDRPLTDYCPMYKSPKEDPIATQFTMNEVEEIGLLKMDFLGIKNLTIIRRVENWLREREGIEIDWTKIPLNDRKAYEVLHKGYTLGVFQLESGGMTTLVKALKPSEFADLTALIALYRPGPLQAGMHTVYVERKHGRQEVTYDHPKLEPILRETYGIILYQEQVMIIARELSGFTQGEADVLRKAMGKKIAEVMEKQSAKFIEGAEKVSGVPRELATHIWDQIVTFAGYGFNKSHSAAYAVVTFQTAYLRAHYPVYFMAALLTNEISGSGTDGIARYAAHCREIGIELRPVDINNSRGFFNPQGNAIYYALSAIKGVGQGFVDALVAERDKGGPFKSMQDMLERMPAGQANARVLEALIKTGAFDSLHPNRAALFEAMPRIVEAAQQAAREREAGQSSIFEGFAAEAEGAAQVQLPKTTPWDEKTRANYEKEFLGMFLSEHPLNRYIADIDSFVTHTSTRLKETAEELKGNDSRDGVTVLGVLTSVQVRQDKNGRPWAIVVVEDMEGTIEAKLFARSYEANRNALEPDSVVWMKGRLSVWNGRPSFDVFELKNAREVREGAKAIELRWPCTELNAQGIMELKDICRRFGGKRPLQVVVATPDGAHTVEFRPNGQCRIALSDEALAALRALPGRPALRLVV